MESNLKELRSGTYAIRVFNYPHDRGDSGRLVDELAERIGGRVALDGPDVELTVVRGGREDYLAITSPRLMKQNWVVRRPRARAFFHPSAIFPKFSRSLVNLSRVSSGESFLDPFCGTGSLLLEAAEIGARPIGVDLHLKMVVGAIRNQRKYAQEWLGVIRGDSRRAPISRVDAIATDVPYGRVSTTSGSSPGEILESLINEASVLLSSGRRLIVMHPDSLDASAARSEFVIEEQIRVPVHKKLTRVVTVLRRR
jgi:tRNA (guanine10-N2)-dimethyltransferase